MCRAINSAWWLWLRHVCEPCTRLPLWWTRSSPERTSQHNIRQQATANRLVDIAGHNTHRSLFGWSVLKVVQKNFVHQWMFNDGLPVEINTTKNDILREDWIICQYWWKIWFMTVKKCFNYEYLVQSVIFALLSWHLRIFSIWF